MMLTPKKSKPKVVNGFKHLTKPTCIFPNYLLYLIHPLSFSYKKWLNKSKVTDRELPDSRRNRSTDQIQGDEISSAQTKPRIQFVFRIDSFGFLINFV